MMKDIDRPRGRSTAKNGGKSDRVPISCIEGSYCSVEEIRLADGPKGPETLAIDTTMALVPCRCKSQWCEDCRTKHMVEWREKLRPVIGSWGKGTMITLTIDRKRFEGPEQAYLEIQAKRAVHEFVKKLHRRGLIETAEFFYAIEFHPSSPEWVHWHLAVRATAEDILPAEELGLNRFLGQHWLADLWGHGLVCVSAGPEETVTEDGEVIDGGEFSAEHLMHYLTKYISKQDVEPPAWVLDSTRRFRKFSTSRGLCKAVESRKQSTKPRGSKQKQRTPREIRRACAQETKVLHITRYRRKYHGGFKEKKRYRFAAQLPTPWAELDVFTKAQILDAKRIPDDDKFSRATLQKMQEQDLSRWRKMLEASRTQRRRRATRSGLSEVGRVAASMEETKGGDLCGKRDGREPDQDNSGRTQENLGFIDGSRNALRVQARRNRFG